MTKQPDRPDAAAPVPGIHPVLGTLLERNGVGVVRLQDRLPADVDEVWHALTEPGRLVQWLGTVEGDLTVGGEFRGHWAASGWEGTCLLEACEPPRRLLLRTTTEDQPQGVVEVSLRAEDGLTTVVLEDRGIPVADLPAYAAGDQIHLEDLAAHLAGRGRCDARARWEELYPAYRELPVGPG